ncbi:sarcosine oxidase subunit gamma [Roseibium algae]|uniref:Sarcosine oxidase subunit gamma family protein n=1 Tax=Roseibium algae TaxID=3123038 RepID=A0ABU8TK32_9HYPH
MADDLIGSVYTPDAGETPLLSLADVSILKAAPLARISLRAREASLAEIGTAFGTSIPTRPLTAETAQGRAALWLGPDEWLLLASEADLEPIQTSIADKLGAQPHALVDVSDRQDALIVTGSKAEWLLNSGIPIDLDITAFPVGMVTRTLFHKAPVMVLRTGSETYVVEAWGSFMDYVTGLLLEASEELAV